MWTVWYISNPRKNYNRFYTQVPYLFSRADLSRAELTTVIFVIQAILVVQAILKKTINEQAIAFRISNMPMAKTFGMKIVSKNKINDSKTFLQNIYC